MTIRLDHTGFVVEDLAAAIAFFVELGLELEGETTVEGEWVDQLHRTRRRPSGHGLPADSRRQRPGRGVYVPNSRPPPAPPPRAPVNTPGIPRLTFVVDAVDDVLDRLRPHGAELVGEVAQYEDIYRYGYIRGPDGIIIGLVEELR